MEKEINFLVLRYLETHLDKEDYEKLLQKLLSKLPLPTIYSWTGKSQQLSFEQIMLDHLHFPSNYLIDLFGTLVHSSKAPIYAIENIGFSQKIEEQSSFVKKNGENLIPTKNSSFSLRKRNTKFEAQRFPQVRGCEDLVNKFSLMKTVFGHACLSDEPMAISCIKFDLTNKYIITGADDRLVKVWLASNASLQGVLHGHTDVIMDIHISYCNRYIISAGKEGAIKIWDLKLLKHLHTCEEHKGSVNSIKVVQTKLANSEVQLLYSGSDDGLINVYNLDIIENYDMLNDQNETPVKTRRAKPVEKKNPLYLLSLSSIEFTGLKKNKKIDCIDISNKRGLIFSGCYSGDLMIWRTDNYRREKVVHDAYELVSKIKAHSHHLHMISISPDENFFMTGSVDGTANIWRQPETAAEINELVLDLENGRKEGNTKKEHPLKKRLVTTLKGSEMFSISQCDSIIWSCRGRYAIAAFGGKEEEDSILDQSVIYVWDQRKQKVIHRFGSKDSNVTLQNFTFVLETHPKDENFFISGGGAGKVNIWNIEKGTCIKCFSETGIYNRDPNILNEVFDGKFSTCGKFFVVSTLMGTYSIYSIYSKEPYYATPVEQFFQYDKLPEATSNIYNERDAELCNYDRMRYPEQPPPPILGERYIGKYLTNERYEKEYGDRYSKFMKDQKFFENYAEEFAPYAFLNSPQDNRGNEGSSDRSSNESYDSRQPYRRRNRHSVSSDEDFVVESSPDRVGNRRTIRRQPYHSRDAVVHEERKTDQREERAQRRHNRNLRRNDEESKSPSISVDDSDEFIEDINYNMDSDYSEDSLMKEAATKKKPVIRNHNFYSSKAKQSDSESDEIITSRVSVAQTKKSNTKDLLNSTRVLYEEEKAKLPKNKSNNVLLCRNNSEDYEFIRTLQGDCYRIDVEEAVKMNEQDKTNLDCALCKKKKGEHNLIGPFKYYIKDKVRDEMVYWFHRECLERNEIIKQISKYEFENILECANQWIIGYGHECNRCGKNGASIQCKMCRKYYHGFKCSYLRMTKDYEGHLVCLECLTERLNEQLTDDFLDQIDQKLMKDNVYKDINREMFYENIGDAYIPQIGDIVYFNFQGYEEVLGNLPYHFITIEPERNTPLNDYFNVLLGNNNLSSYSTLTHSTLKCEIKELKYQLPSATTHEINRKLNTGNSEFSIQSEVKLCVIEPEEAKDTEFTIMYFNTDSESQNISINYLIPSECYEESIKSCELQEICLRQLKSPLLHEPPKEIIEISDYEPEVYPSSSYKCICYKQNVYNVKSDGHQLRANVTGRAQVIKAGRISSWEVKRNKDYNIYRDGDNFVYEETRQFNNEHAEPAFNDIERAKIVEIIDSYVKNNSIASNFINIVTDDVAPDYLNVIAVEMNLYTIRDNIETNRYRSKQMMLNDLKLIEFNCIEFNSKNTKISKEAKQVHDTLKKFFEKMISNKLRSIPQRTVNTRNRIDSATSEISENKNTKRNPKKASPIQLRSSRRKNVVNYNEEDKDDESFKKPTPQKHQKYSDESDSTPMSNGDFKISLDRNSRNLHRSSRSKNQSSYKGIKKSKDERKNRKRIKAQDLMSEFEESKTMRETRTRKREEKNNSKVESSFDYNEQVNELQKKRLNNDMQKKLLKRRKVSESDEDYEESD